MQLHSMTIAALGPFADRYTVDVARLGADGLFLLEGPTGAGKSTLIDALVFGLYGKLGYETTCEDRLRSAFAGPSDETFVDVVFEVNAGVFRVRRTPTYTRARRRGAGTTTANATARLWRLPATWADAVAGAGDDEDPLVVLDRTGEPLATRLDEVGQRVVDLVGLEREQFVQTVVLPQGEFARFLRARPEHRRELLGRIFGTEVYERLAERLAEMRRTGEQSVREARAALLEATARLVGAARLDSYDLDVQPGGPASGGPSTAIQLPEPEPAGPPFPADREPHGLVQAVAELVPVRVKDASVLVAGVHQLVDPVTTSCEQAATVTTTQAATARAAAVEAAHELAEHERLTARVAERDRLRARAATLAADADAQAARVARLAAARSAREVAGLLSQAEAAQTQVVSATRAAAQAHQCAPAEVRAGIDCAHLQDPGSGSGPWAGTHRHGPGAATQPDQPHGPQVHTSAGPLTTVDDRSAALDEAVNHLLDVHTTAVAQVAALDPAARAEAGLHDARLAVTALTTALADATTATTQADEQAAARPPARAQLAEQVAQARVTAAGTPAAEQTLAQAQVLVGTLDDLASARADLAAAHQALTDAQDAARQAVAHEAALRQARIANLAGELATTLVADTPCPVCGALDHPAPAALSADHVDAAGVDHAETRRRALEQAAEEQGRTTVRLDERVAALAAQAGDHTPTTAADALACANDALAKCRRAADALVAGEEALVVFDAEAAAAEDHRRDLAEHRTTTSAALDVAADRLASDETTVAQARGDHVSVAARQEAASSNAAAAVRLANALRDLAAAWRSADRTTTDLADALSARDLQSADAARAALLTPGDLAALERSITDHTTATTHVAAGLDELADLDDDLTGEQLAERTAAATLAATTTSDVAGAAEARAAVAAQVRTDVVAAADQVFTAARDVADTVTANAPVTRMAGLVSGQGADNARHLSLATYVLARRFADVTAAANERLTAISGGHYALVPSGDKEAVAARTTGLAMRVVDHWTGTQRDPRTLSGGEAFYVSLCLALGLADVVGAEAGGISLGTLFVDEGFGSLDAEVLDQVLTELSRLRAGGRTVAVVSHVETLKQAIADRIEVRITSEGPSTLRVVP